MGLKMEIRLSIYNKSKLVCTRNAKLPCVIGRNSKRSNISIMHPLISRQHCEIYEEKGVIKVRDLGSLNGTYFKEQRIKHGTVIPVGEGFSIGSLIFIVQSSNKTTPMKLPPQARSETQPNSDNTSNNGDHGDNAESFADFPEVLDFADKDNSGTYGLAAIDTPDSPDHQVAPAPKAPAGSDNDELYSLSPDDFVDDDIDDIIDLAKMKQPPK